MHEIKVRIPDEAYATVERRARQEGFGNAEVFLSDYIVTHIAADSDAYDHLFTPEVIAAIDMGAQEVREGKSMTRDQVTAYLTERRNEWLENHPA